MNFNHLLKDAIVKGSSRIVRKPVAALRQDVASLKRQVAELRRQVRGLQRALPKPVAVPEAEAEGEGKRLRRPTADKVKQLRSKLDLTQAEMGRLLGVSALTVSKWECGTGVLTLRKRTLRAYQSVRGLGKREARAKLAAG